MVGNMLKHTILKEFFQESKVEGFSAFWHTFGTLTFSMKKISPAHYIHVWKAVVQVANLKSNPGMTKKGASSLLFAPLRQPTPLRVKGL